MGRRLLIGSGNRDKAAELSTLLEGTSWDVQGLGDFPAVDEPVEDADTFEGNALLKARYYGGRFEMACVADDSGLEVDALDGAPGIYAARYAGEGCTYDDNNRKLLSELAGVPADARTARFICCAAFVDEDGAERTERGVVEGHIATACSGTKGFGYDPLFIPEGHTKTFSELEPSEKHAISHRGDAFRKMCAYLKSVG